MHRKVLLPVLYSDVEEELLKIPIQGTIFPSNYPNSNTMIFVKNTKEAYLALRKDYQFFDIGTHIEIENDVRMGFNFIYIPKENN